MKTCAALFDLDGVIIDSEPQYTIFWADIDRRYPTGVPDFAYAIKGTNLSKIVMHFPEELRQPIIDELHAYEYNMRYVPFNGALEYVAALRRSGVKTAIVTSSDSVKMQHLFNQLPQLETAVDVVINGSMVSRSKPDPEGYLTAARMLGVEPQDCWVFEDSLQGLEAGRRSGATVVGLTTSNPVDVIAPLCDVVTPSLAALPGPHKG